ncbi:MAG TPA: hypothetical protein DCZ03_09760 [Gammaproteobacteria bacterium]|nr:hypothetical protein [Gammaproteobacteria bacterium]
MDRYSRGELSKRIGLGLATILAAVPIAVSADTGSLTGARYLEVVEVKGESLPDIMGQTSEGYSVMAVSNGALAPIPFQFDDLNKKGFIYVPGGSVEIDGEEGVFEAHDELAFMYKDTGPQASAELLSAVSGEVIAEIELSDMGSNRYAYVLKGNSARSDIQYAKFNRETGLIETTMYSQKVDPDNLLIWEDYKYKTFAEDRSLLDTMKLRVRAKLGPARATITNKLIPNEIVGVKNAPVRSIIEMDASIAILGIQLASAGASVTVTENTLEFPVFLAIPTAAKVLQKNLAIEISLDFDQLEGSRIRTALGPTEPIITGSEDGIDPKQHNVSLEENWLSLSSGKGWDIIAFFERDEAFDPTLSLLYKDKGKGDKKDKPERVKGSDPQVGYIAKDIPVGIDSYLAINLYFGEDLWNGNQVENAVKQITNPVPAKVKSL